VEHRTQHNAERDEHSVEQARQRYLQRLYQQGSVLPLGSSSGDEETSGEIALEQVHAALNTYTQDPRHDGRNVKRLLDLAYGLCPDSAPKGEDGWRAVLWSGEIVLRLGVGHVRRDVERPDGGDVFLERLVPRLVQVLRQASLDPAERVEAGYILAQLGDPRFRIDAWHLPDEPLLGFVEIPEGSFLMGTREEDVPVLLEHLGGEREWFAGETPQHELTLPTYYIARYPVTVAQYRAFIENSGYWTKDADSVQGVNTHPVMRVTWYDALEYCDWLTKKLRAWWGTPKPLAELLQNEGWVITLPSEAQWEKAARGKTQVSRPQLQSPDPRSGRVFPWGDAPDPNRANCYGTEIGTTSAVGCFPGGASLYGVEDLSGNVLEWTRSLWKDYPYDPDDGRETLGRSDVRVARGGSFVHGHGRVRCASRHKIEPDFLARNLGFRVVVSSPQI
jgi:formylglycine-generating enzyme required for sulfatase activity